MAGTVLFARWNLLRADSSRKAADVSPRSFGPNLGAFIGTNNHAILVAMPLTREDWVVLSRQIEELIRRFDPVAHDAVLNSTERFDDPRRYVIEQIRTLMRYYSERSGGKHGQILDRVNRYVRQPDGRPVRGISVELTPGERERYQTDELNLAELPDHNAFVNELESILADIIDDAGIIGGLQ